LRANAVTLSIQICIQPCLGQYQMQIGKLTRTIGWMYIVRIYKYQKVINNLKINDINL